MAQRKRIWTAEEIEVIRSEYANSQTSELALKLGRSEKSIFSQAFLLGLKKSEEFMKSNKSGRIQPGERRGEVTFFKKGQQSWNKGKKGYMGANVTSFKKGNKPHNHKPIGSTRHDKDGYLVIKVAEPNKWKFLHRHIWEQAHGKIEKGFNVIFKDGNKLNTELFNLEVISKVENMQRNNINRYPEEIVATIRTITKLKKTIKKHGTK